MEKCFREDKIRLESGMIEKGTILIMLIKRCLVILMVIINLEEKCCDLLEGCWKILEEIKIEN